MAVALEELIGPAGSGPYGDRRARPRLRVVGPEERRGTPPHRRAARGMYIRRRIAVAMAVAGVVTAAAVAVTPLLSTAATPTEVAHPEVFHPAGAATAVTAPATQDVPATVVVAEGQTVWERVAKYAPAGRSQHDWVAQVLDMNDVDPLAIAPGTTLRLPARQ